jgi:AhpD family alkylhydroperoxidase
MQPRMKNPVLHLPGALEAIHALHKSMEKADVPRATLELVNLRASQINGCSVCVDMHWRALRPSMTDERATHPSARRRGGWRSRVALVDLWRPRPRCRSEQA